METIQSGTSKFFIASLVILSFAFVSRSLPASPEYVTAATLITQKNYAEAIPHLNKSIQTEPNRVLAYVLRASAYNSIGQFDFAIQDCNKAISLNPHEPRAWTKRAYALIGLEKYDEAIDDCDQAISLTPKLAQAFEYRAQAYKKLGKPEIALQDLNMAKELNVYGASLYR